MGPADKARLAEAEKELARARELAAGEPEAYVATVQFLAGQQRLNDALALME
jgi:hypothetical protein